MGAMAIRPALLALACAAPLAGAGCRCCEPRSGARTGATSEMEAVVRSQEAAWNRGDLDGFMALGYWRSAELHFLSGGSWTRGYDSALGRYRERYASGGKEMGRLAFTELDSEALAEDAGLVRGRWELFFSDGGRAGGLFTLVMRRFPEGWRIVHDHTSSGT